MTPAPGSASDRASSAGSTSIGHSTKAAASIGSSSTSAASIGSSTGSASIGHSTKAAASIGSSSVSAASIGSSAGSASIDHSTKAAASIGSSTSGGFERFLPWSGHPRFRQRANPDGFVSSLIQVGSFVEIDDRAVKLFLNDSGFVSDEELVLDGDPLFVWRGNRFPSRKTLRPYLPEAVALECRGFDIGQTFDREVVQKDLEGAPRRVATGFARQHYVRKCQPGLPEIRE